MILDELSFEKDLLNNQMVFFGSGSDKWKLICKHENAIFKPVAILPKSLGKSTNVLFLEKKFTELAYSEPLYLKEFQTVIKS
jgi:tRNA threonylcarbamoyladenosine biosynthesis protein TsaB